MEPSASIIGSVLSLALSMEHSASIIGSVEALSIVLVPA